MSSFESSPWPIRHLKSLCRPVKMVDPHRNPNTRIRYIDIASISNESFSIIGHKALLGSEAPSRARKLVQTGDVLFATTRPYLRSIAKVPAELDGEICSTGLCVLRSDDGLDPDWMFFAVRSADFLDQIVPKMRGASYPAVTDRDILEAGIPMPPLEVQRRIVSRIHDCLSRLEEVSGLGRALATEAKYVLPSAMREAYVTLCRDRKTVTLSSIADVTGGGTPSKENAGFWQGSIPWVSPKDMKVREIYDATDHVSADAIAGSATKLIKAPAVLFVVRGMILAHTLPVAISRVDVTINQDMKALKPKSGVSPEFLGFMLRGAAPDLLNQVEVAGHGTRRLQSEKWMTLPIPDLSPGEQASLVSELQQIERTADEAMDLTSENLIQALRDSVLRHAFAGEL